jgi:predicted transcriptional regulator of viral defense system
MSEPQTQRDRVVRLLGERGIMRLSEFKAHGIHPLTLTRLIGQGLILRPARGLYELSDAEIGSAHSLAEMAKRVPNGAICLISALQFHGITLQTPRSVWVAIRARDRTPAVTHVATHFVRFSEAAMAMGLTTQMIDQVPVKIFDPAKTVVDCFRFRRVVGLDVALEALRLALRSGKATPDMIATYAKSLRIWSVLRPYLESVVADDA